MGGERIESFRDLRVWQQARRLATSVYRLTKSSPANERFGLTQQLRRAAVSVPSNIAEGWGRGAGRDFTRFLHIARGSLCEIETQLLLSEDLGFLRDSEYDALLAEVYDCSRMLSGLIRSMQRREQENHQAR